MKLIVFFLSLLAASGAVVTFSREYDVAYLARSSEPAAFDVFSSNSGVPGIPLSNRSMRELFETCGAVQQGLIYGFQPPETRAEVDTTCRTLANDALQRNPTFSAAYAIAMLSSSDPAEVSESLIRSQLTAPRESWHAKLRLRKGLPLYGTGQQALDDALASDIIFMVQSRGGRIWLARLYQSSTSIRPAIVSVINSRPNTEQAAFLQEVRRLGQS